VQQAAIALIVRIYALLFDSLRRDALKGKILACKDQGLILGDDERRYTFDPSEDWKTDGNEPKSGQEVDFIPHDDGIANDVYLLGNSNTSVAFNSSFQKGNLPRIVYGLYTISLIIGITAIVGVIIAYIQRGESDELEKAHYNWQIRTFWNAVIGFIISVTLFFAGIGILIFWFVYIWYIYRIVWGWVKFENNKAV